MEEIIGFADRYYTLWQVSQEERERYGVRETVTVTTFIKNISMSLEKTKHLYPGVKVDTSLHGHSGSFETVTHSKPVHTDTSVFAFGKYKGMKLTECGDSEYILWYSENVDNEDCAMAARAELKSRGWTEHNGYMWSPEESVKMEGDRAYCRNLKEGFTFTPEHNPDESGDMKLPGHDYIVIHFQHYKEMYYNGYVYSLPVTDGRARRVKGKTVIVDGFHIEHDQDWQAIDIIIEKFHM